MDPDFSFATTARVLAFLLAVRVGLMVLVGYVAVKALMWARDQ